MDKTSRVLPLLVIKDGILEVSGKIWMLATDLPWQQKSARTSFKETKALRQHEQVSDWET